MTKSGQQKKSNIVWRFFSSLRLALVLLILLAITSIVGTVIPQQQGAMEFAQKLSPGMIKIFSSLQLFDMYHSLWFRLIISALALNLVICSINRFPGALKLFRTRPKPDRKRPFEDISPDRTFFIRGKNDISEVADRVAEAFRRQYKNIERKHTEKGDFFYGESGRYSHFGVYLVHLSVLIIIIGTIIGSLAGFEAFVNIPEGETIDTVRLRKSGAPKKLGFSVHCEKFSVQFYKNGAPKEFRSILSFLSNGNVVEKKNLLVNHPITFKGVAFYQASYGSTPGNRVHLTITKKGTNNDGPSITVMRGKPFQLPGDDAQFVVANIQEDFMRMGPAVHIAIKPPEGEETHFWLFQHQEMIKNHFPGIFEKFQKLNPSSYKPYTFFLDKIENSYYTGLQVNKDPGVSFVWLGCFMMVGGFFITFFMSHRRVWVRVSKREGKINISVAGSANKNPVGMERELDHLTNKLKKLL